MLRPSLRRRRLRPARPSLYWTAAIGLAAVTALVVQGLVARAEDARHRWGDVVDVPVAATELSPGEVVDASDVVMQRWPEALLPPGAVDEAPVGRVVVSPVLAGEPFVRARIAPEGLSPVAALLPPGTLAVAVPAPALALEVGDRVDVLATFDPSLTGDEDPSFAVAEAAVVVAVSDDSVTVAVTEAEAPLVAFALAQGIVTLALRGR